MLVMEGEKDAQIRLRILAYRRGFVIMKAIQSEKMIFAKHDATKTNRSCTLLQV
jgi:hypothetical protein